MTPEQTRGRDVAALDLRPETEADRDFALALFRAVQAPPLIEAGVPAVVVDHLVAIQFRGQGESYRARFPQARRLILAQDGRAVGRMIVSAEAAALYVVDIAVDPAARNRGLGGAAVARIQGEAGRAGLSVRALVLPGNGASLAMFRRRGFAETGRSAGPALEFAWTAGPAGTP